MSTVKDDRMPATIESTTAIDMMSSSCVRRTSQVDCHRKVDGYQDTHIDKSIAAERLGQSLAVTCLYRTEDRS